MKWEILIATLSSRQHKLARLLSELMPQVDEAAGMVSVTALWNHGERDLCGIRQDLLDHATGEYTCFIDDDDEVPEYYVSRVLPLLDGTDYIGWRMQVRNKIERFPPTFHSLRYSSWSNDNDGMYRDISHLNPVRRALTSGTSFCGGNGEWEDFYWIKQLRGRLETEHFIEDCMYFYNYEPHDSVQHQTAVKRAGLSRLEVESTHFSWHPASSS